MDYNDLYSQCRDQDLYFLRRTVKKFGGSAEASIVGFGVSEEDALENGLCAEKLKEEDKCQPGRVTYEILKVKANAELIKSIKGREARKMRKAKEEEEKE